MPFFLLRTLTSLAHVFFRWQCPLRDLSMIVIPIGTNRSFRSAIGEI